MYRIYILILLCTVGILLLNHYVYGQGPAIVISEIGAYEANGYEWIELYNRSSNEVIVDDWVFWENNSNHSLTLIQGSSTVPAESFFIITQDSEKFLEKYSVASTTIFDSSWGALNESGELIALKDAQGNVVEEFVYVSSTEASLERIDQDSFIYTIDNWKAHPQTNSVGNQNYWSTHVPTSSEQTTSSSPQDSSSTSSTRKEHDLFFINEVVSNPQEGNEWIELFYSGTSSVSLHNWQIFDGAGKIATVSTSLEPQQVFVIELSKAVLNNSGDHIILKNASGESIDELIYGQWDGASVSAPGKGQSIARDPATQTFQITEQITKGEENRIVRPQKQDNTISNDTSDSNIVVIESGQLRINEILSDPGDGMEEFVELYNATQQTMILDNLYIEDGSESKTLIDGTIDAQGFFLIEKPKGNLNNSGDRIILYNSQGAVLDSLTYGNWDDGNLSDNAPIASDPFSLARKAEHIDTHNNYQDFVLTKTITPGAANSISSQEFMSENNMSYSQDILLNEIFPNPEGSDSKTEFIELYNRGNISISLFGWQLADSSKRVFHFPEIDVAPQRYVIVLREQSGIALNNSGVEEVKLFAPNGERIDSTQYSGKVEENMSYARFDNEWLWTTRVTAEAENILAGAAAAPIISTQLPPEGFVDQELYFDASDTSDADSDSVFFQWNLGDGYKQTQESFYHRYNQPGIYEITLNVQDDEGNSSSIQSMISIYEIPGTQQLSSSSFSHLQISEVVPNPEGSDQAEFIELFNAGFESIDVGGLFLDDEDGGSRPYEIPFHTIIPAQSYLVFPREQTGIALNNTGDAVRVLDTNKQVLIEIVYESSIEGASYVADELGNFIWSMQQTPGSVNILDEADIVVASTKKSSKDKPIIATTIVGAKQQDIGDRVEVYGSVAVLPGVYGTQYFYIVDENAQAIQIYMYKKDFPNLSVGEGIYVRGELSQSKGELRIKISEKTDIQKHDQPGLEDPIIKEIAEVKERSGEFVEIHAEVTEVKSSYVYIDDGSDEIKVYMKRGAGIPKKVVSVGDLVRVSGITVMANEEMQLLPRGSADIVKTGVVEQAYIEKSQDDVSENRILAERYLTATAGGITSIMFGLFAKLHGASVWRFVRQLVKK